MGEGGHMARTVLCPPTRIAVIHSVFGKTALCFLTPLLPPNQAGVGKVHMSGDELCSACQHWLAPTASMSIALNIDSVRHELRTSWHLARKLESFPAMTRERELSWRFISS